ncbi:spore coat protein YlbD [Fictibacillus aquaticus]|uniref:Coat protein n=1 Tax=Fictibacillus aquaticus TaxID=2021314 RepID=A0A235FDF6_9BACL|nr:spore coat protein YlbD [Fictibacillus aquaticus]OYD58973.1 hypothetical protein CGZ90_03465 [Fictibacillus aquaticus]
MGKNRVEEFKKFIVKHPAVIKEVKNNKRTWKEVYHDWIVLGEDHESWNRTTAEDSTQGTKNAKTENEKKQTDETKKVNDETKKDRGEPKKKRKELTVGEIVSMLGKINVSDLQTYISQFGGAVEGIQQLIQHFQSNPQGQTVPERDKPLTYQTYKD